jgi:hypothetical protein
MSPLPLPLLGNPGDRSTPRPELALQLTHHRHRAFLQLHQILAGRCHALDPFQNQRPPTNPGWSKGLSVSVRMWSEQFVRAEAECGQQGQVPVDRVGFTLASGAWRLGCSASITGIPAALTARASLAP